MIRIAFTFVAVLALCASSNAAVRTFGASGLPADISVSDGTFELATNWFSNTKVDDTIDGDIISTASIFVGPGFSTIVPGFDVGQTYTLSRVDTSGGSLYLTFTYGAYGDGASSDLLFAIPTASWSPAYSGGSEIPDGGSSSAVLYARNGLVYDSLTDSYPTFGNSDPIATNVGVSISAVPEPSAFAFGGLAVVVTGAGRWVRRRFFA